MIVLAHVSDLHATRPRLRHPGEILNKRALGLLSWLVRRRREHRHYVLEALIDDLERTQPDHVAVTGDLTQLGLLREFEQALGWLRRLGDPVRVSLVPGNHDVQVRSRQARSWQHWGEYMRSDPGADAKVVFPSLRIRDGLALVGVSSAEPSAPFLATGRVGRSQREALEESLGKLSGRGLFRVVLIHHPPTDVGLAQRRRLTDASAVRDAIARGGADLVLHGHTHQTAASAIPGANGPIPVAGVPSASALGRRGDARRARYHVYRIEPGESAGSFQIRREVRGYRPESGCFESEGEAPVQG